jgi:hypothetical protein
MRPPPAPRDHPQARGRRAHGASCHDGHGHAPLGSGVAAALGCELTRCDVERFPDGEVRPVVGDVRGDDIGDVEDRRAIVVDDMISTGAPSRRPLASCARTPLAATSWWPPRRGPGRGRGRPAGRRLGQPPRDHRQRDPGRTRRAAVVGVFHRRAARRGHRPPPRRRAPPGRLIPAPIPAIRCTRHPIDSIARSDRVPSGSRTIHSGRVRTPHGAVEIEQGAVGARGLRPPSTGSTGPVTQRGPEPMLEVAVG